MKRHTLARFAAFALAVTLSAALLLGAAAALAAAPDGAEFDGYLVVLHDAAPAPGLLRAAAPEITLTPVIDDLGIYYVDTPDQADPYIRAGLVQGVYPNYYVELADEPNDPYYQPGTADRQAYMDSIGMPQVWAQHPTLNGAGVRVAVIDSGVYRDHPDLIHGGLSCVVDGRNYTEDGLSPYNDINGHGTRVAGIIAAATNNGIGIASIAGGVSIVSLKAFYMDGGTAKATIDHVLVALRDAVDEYQCDVINMSFRFKTTNDLPHAPLTNVLEYAASKGALLVAAAGNDGRNTTPGSTGVPEQFRPSFPAANEIVVGVGALNADGTVAELSQRHTSTTISAPGIGIVSTTYEGGAARYSAQSGTSFSAPMVAAAAALMKQIDPGITQSQFKALVMQSAIPLSGSDERSAYGGAGMLNIPRLLQNRSVATTVRAGDGVQTIQAYFWQLDGDGMRQLLIAGYDENSRMIEVRYLPALDISSGTLSAEFSPNLSATKTVKFFLLDSTAAPVAPAAQATR